jgi:hypothetical protein
LKLKEKPPQLNFLTEALNIVKSPHALAVKEDEVKMNSLGIRTNLFGAIPLVHHRCHDGIGAMNTGRVHPSHGRLSLPTMRHTVSTILTNFIEQNHVSEWDHAKIWQMISECSRSN